MCCWLLCVELCCLFVRVVVVYWLLVVDVVYSLWIGVGSLIYVVGCNMFLSVIACCELLLSFILCC